MAKSKNRQIVVDASVASAAGTSENPVSIDCRSFLMEFRDASCFGVMYAELKREWDDHSSGFAADWLASMIGAKRIVFIQREAKLELKTKLGSVCLTKNENNHWTKDFHLICACLQTGKSIASRDRKAEAVFRKLAASVQTLHKIEWFDPERDAAHTQRWLQGKNPQKLQFCLKP